MDQAWVWAVAGVLLAALEVVVAGNVLLGFACGALSVAFLLWIGVSASLPVLLLIMSVVALIAWLLLRRSLGGSKGDVRIVERDINE